MAQSTPLHAGMRGVAKHVNGSPMAKVNDWDEGYEPPACPRCGFNTAKLTKSEAVGGGYSRDLECTNCKTKFRTWEPRPGDPRAA